MERARDVYVIGAYSTRFGKCLEKSMKDLTRDAYLGVDKFYHSHMAKVLAAYMAYVPTLLYDNKAMGSTLMLPTEVLKDARGTLTAADTH